MGETDLCLACMWPCTRHVHDMHPVPVAVCFPVPLAGHCSGNANITLPPSTLPSFVHLNLTCNVIAIQGGQVLDVFERAIMAFSRPTDPDHETGDQQVRISGVLVHVYWSQRVGILMSS